MTLRPRASTAAVAAAAIAAALALGAGLAHTRAARAEAYATARAAQRRAATATRPATPPVPPAPPAATRVACVTGVEGFAAAVERALVPLPAWGAPRARRLAALRQLSDTALRAERTAELSRPPPTLPKRMGLDGTEPVVPEKPACDGKGFAELTVSATTR